MCDNVNYSQGADNYYAQGQGKLNQLGGRFINGRPLPIEVRVQIIKLYSAGVKPCEISRMLKVSHGCVSKILNRFHDTGSIEPGLNGASKSRLAFNTYGISNTICQRLHEYLKEDPFIQAWALHNKLLIDGVCNIETVPQIEQISLFLKSRHDYYQQFFDTSAEFLPQLSKKKKVRRPRTTFSKAQLNTFEAFYREREYASTDVLHQLSEQTKVNKEVISVWFCNRRSRERKLIKAAENSMSSPGPSTNNSNHYHFDNNVINSVINDVSESNSSIDSNTYIMNSPHMQLRPQPHLQLPPQSQHVHNQQMAHFLNPTYGHSVYDCHELKMTSSPPYALPPTSETSFYCNGD